MAEETSTEEPEVMWNPWDTLMKTLIPVAIQALVWLFLPGARVLEKLNTEMIFNLYGKKFQADFFL